MDEVVAVRARAAALCDTLEEQAKGAELLRQSLFDEDDLATALTADVA